jgi:hypothetical protein
MHMIRRITILALLSGASLSSLADAVTPVDEWPKVAKAFQQALTSGNVEGLEKAILAVIDDNSKRSVELVLKGVRSSVGHSYWMLIASLGRLTSEESMDAIVDEVLTGKSPELRRDLIMSFRLSSTDIVCKKLQRLVKEGTPDIQVSVLDEIVDRCDMSAVTLLLDLAEKDPSMEKELTRRIYKALRALAKHMPVGGPAEWRAWWNTLKDGIQAEPLRQRPVGAVGQTVTSTLGRARATDFEDLKKGAKEAILVITGASDSVQDILVGLDVPHTLVAGERVERNDDLSLEKYSAVIVNCGPQGWPSAQINRVRNYVTEGGYLCVTDLIIQHVVKEAFPGYYINKGGLPDATVSIFPWKGSTGNPLLRGVDLPISDKVGTKSRMEWMIAPGGPALTFDPKKVVWLIEAPELALKRKVTAVALTFLYGGDPQLIQQGVDAGGVYEELARIKGGRVLCLLSHFGKQRQGEDGFALQNLLLNFLIEARDRHLMREDAKGKKK